MSWDWIPSAWYLAASSGEVRGPRPSGVELEGRSLALWRATDGSVHAADARCPHMGASLAAGCVEGDTLRCGLHHFRYDPRGRCVEMPGAPGEAAHAPKLRIYPAIERFGGVFVFLGRGEPFAPPHLRVHREADLAWTAGPPVEVACHWPPLVTNGFDLQHLRTVHGRELRTEPAITVPDPHTFELRYVSRVTGRGAADRAMKWLSGDHIDVTVSCHGGSVMMAEVELGATRSAVLMGVQPRGERTVARCLFGVPSDARATRLRLWLARWLYTAFLRKDIEVLRGMRFHGPPPLRADAVLRAFVAYLEALEPAP